MLNRLYRKIYLTIIASLVLTVIVAGAAWRFGSGGRPDTNAFKMIGILATNPLPPESATKPEQQKILERLAKKLGADLALYTSKRELIAAVGRQLPAPPRHRRHRDGHWHYGHPGAAVSIRLPDRRWVVARLPRQARHPAIGLVLMLSAIAGTIALCAYPVVRGLTRRLEKLQTAVETLGQGRLATRVNVEGKDEVASLAMSFNRAAARIEELIAANRMLLANTSHELRTPLTRIRLGLERLDPRADPAVADRLRADITELDNLIDELLLASRLDTNDDLDVREPIDLLGLAAEECARYDDCSLDGAPATVSGDPALLRRLIRNLLDNAEKHGTAPITVTLSAAANNVRLDVSDAGPGIPRADRERAFEAFYRAQGTASKSGTGLGLALVRQIAMRHGGTAEIADDGATASTIRITLPRKDDKF